MTTVNRQLVHFSLAIIGFALLRALLAPHFFPGEQHHYLNIALHLWRSSHWLPLHDDGGLYFNKPPLLFWTIKALWLVTGPNDPSLVLLPALFAVVSVCLLSATFSNLWPDLKNQAGLPAAVLFGSLFFLLSSNRFTFDGMVLCCTVLTLYSISLIATQRKYAWCLYAVAITLGFLSKGPIIFCYTLVPILFLIIGHKQFSLSRAKLFCYLGLSLLCCLVVVGLWLSHIYQALGWQQFQHYIIHRGLGAGHTYGHKSFGFYLYKFPPLLLPWIIWIFLWRRTIHAVKTDRDPVFRLLLHSSITIFVILSCIAGKATRYILPLIAYTSLLIAYIFARAAQTEKMPENLYKSYFWGLGVLAVGLLAASPFSHWLTALYPLAQFTWQGLLLPGLVLLGGLLILWRSQTRPLTSVIMRISVLSGLLMLICMVGYMPIAQRVSSFDPLIDFLQQPQRRTAPVAYVRYYGGDQYTAGPKRLPAGKVISTGAMVSWAQQHPEGYIIWQTKRANHTTLPTRFVLKHSLRHVVIIAAKDLYTPRILKHEGY